MISSHGGWMCACSPRRFSVYMSSVLLTFIRWFMLVRVIEPKFKLSSTFVLGAIGMVFNLVIPGGVGGDLIKASYLVRMRIRRTQAIASMVIDRILGLLALFILAAVAGAIGWGGSARDVRTLAVLAWLAVLAGVLVLVAIFTGAFSRLFPRAAEGGSKFGLIVSELREMSTTYRSRLNVVFGCLAPLVLIHVLNVLAFFLVGCMLYPEMPTTLAQHFSMVPLILFTLAVPLPFGGAGRHRTGRGPAPQAGRPSRRRASHDGLPRRHVCGRACVRMRISGESQGSAGSDLGRAPGRRRESVRPRPLIALRRRSSHPLASRRGQASCRGRDQITAFRRQIAAETCRGHALWILSMIFCRPIM